MPEPICAAEFTYTKEIHLAFARCFFRHFTIKRLLLAEVLYPLIAFLLYFLIMMIEGKPIHTVDALLFWALPALVMFNILFWPAMAIGVRRRYRKTLTNCGGEAPVFSCSFFESDYQIELRVQGTVKESYTNAYALMSRIIADNRILLFIWPAKNSGFALPLEFLDDPDRLLSVLSGLPNFKDARR